MSTAIVDEAMAAMIYPLKRLQGDAIKASSHVAPLMDIDQVTWRAKEKHQEETANCAMEEIPNNSAAD